ncbi:MAG: ion channel [Streptococcus salivarius]|nr:ion channel [Streptococcus salivarius]
MRNRRKLRRYIITYDIVMTVLALISIGLVIFDLVGLISIGRRPFRVIDQSITLIFAIDYAIRFSLAPRKRIFVKTHVLDLLAIIPYNEVFTFLRFSRVGRFARLAKLSRLIGLSSKLKHISNRINRRNGFYFLLSVNSIIILISSAIIARVEHHNFIEAIWWSVATVTTVGYGDIVPRTLVGKAVAVVLMFSGIATLGLLTSSLNNIFVRSGRQTERKLAEIEKELAEQRVILEEIRTTVQLMNSKMDKTDE